MKNSNAVKRKPIPVADVLPTVPETPVATIDPVIEEPEVLKVDELNVDAPAAKKEDEEEEEQEKTDEDWNFERGLLTDFIAPYLDTYPDESEFHITSDGQVFLKANAADAAHYQKSLKDGTEVFVYSI